MPSSTDISLCDIALNIYRRNAKEWTELECRINEGSLVYDTVKEITWRDVFGLGERYYASDTYARVWTVLIAMMYARLLEGTMVTAPIWLGESPNWDRRRVDNQLALGNLPAPFSAEVFLEQKQGEDGQLRWDQDIYLSSLDAEETAIHPGDAVMEIGQTRPAQILWGLTSRRIAIWPYGQKRMFLFHMASGQSFVNLHVPYTPRSSMSLPRWVQLGMEL